MRLVAAFVLAMPALLGAQQQHRFVERVEVARVLIDARVIDDMGRSVLGLEPADFEVKIDGKAVRVETVEWIGGDRPRPESLPSTGLAGIVESQPRGRLIVFVVQKSLEPVRVRGLMRLLHITEPLFAQLTPDDRVAVVSFDSHLKIWLDFTADLDRVRTVLGQDVLLSSPKPIEPSPGTSLVSHLSQARGRKAYAIEEALRLLGNALEPLPGAKSVVLLGYGFGALDLGQALFGIPMQEGYMENSYGGAVAALLAARVTVFALDITDADFHTLEGGLKIIAADTGGFFARTNLFPQLAIRRVTDALTGHYVLFVEKPELEHGTYSMSLRLLDRKGTVLARNAYYAP